MHHRVPELVCQNGVRWGRAAGMIIAVEFVIVVVEVGVVTGMQTQDVIMIQERINAELRKMFAAVKINQLVAEEDVLG